MTEADAEYVREVAAGLRREFRSMLRRVYITQSDDTGAVRTLQIQGLAGQVDDGVEHLEAFGFTSNPPSGTPPNCAEGIKLQIGGDPAHPVVISAFDRRFRPVDVNPGESVMYNEWGDYAKLDQDRNFTLNAGANVNVTAGTKVTVTAPNVEFTGAVKIDGALTLGSTLAVAKAATFSSSASFKKGNVTIGAGVGLLVITPGELKVGGVPVVAP